MVFIEILVEGKIPVKALIDTVIPHLYPHFGTRDFWGYI